jgi:uncharacterized membrane protein
MGYVRGLVGEVADLVAANRAWLAWNTFLALVPLGLALWLLWRPHRRTVGWWVGIVAFVLFLPNAPYVITDLVHLRRLVTSTPSGTAVVVGVLPLLATFIAVGFASYLLCIELIVREVRSLRPDVRRWSVELAIHLTCTTGVVLGRITRLNSWDTVTDPRWTIERSLATLTWRGAPIAFVAIFVAIWATSTVLRTLAVAAWRWGERTFGPRFAARTVDGPGAAEI